MKKIIVTLLVFAGFAIPVLAYDFQSGSLLYTINSTHPTEVTLVGHVDGTEAQGELVIPETVTYEGVTYTVTIIGKRAFSGCRLLTGTLVIPNSVEEIMGAAFYECVGFTGDLVIPNSVTKINVDISMENTVPGAFENCTGFDGRLILSNSLEIIGDAQGGGCFRGCNNLKGELLLPNTLTYIGESAFEFCIGLTGTLVIPESVTEISHNAFASCRGLEGIVFPDTSFTKGISLFHGCTGLTSITIPEGWTSTGDNIFSYCTGLNEVRLPESMKLIESNAFSNCSNLASINFPNGLDEIAIDAFYNCTGLSGTIVIPAKKIYEWAFESCSGIRHLVLGERLNYISELAFMDTNIETMTIKAVVPPTLDCSEAGPYAWHFDRNLPITVPCGSIEAYQNAEGWVEFTNMHEGVTDLLSVASSDEQAGMVIILKEAACDDRMAQVQAVQNEGFEFVYWEANGEQVSTDNPYTFELEDDTELIARFSGTGMDENEQLFSIYPNPVKDQLCMWLSPDVQPVRVEFYDMQGRLVHTQRSAFENIDMAALPAGVYFVAVTDEEGRKCVRKVVRE